MGKTEYADWRILVVDDEPDSIEVVSIVLTSAGATVFSAKNGRAALEVLDKEKLSMVLTDLSMPFMDGWQMLKSIRENEALKKLPVIALTAHARVNEKVMEAGFDGYMIKPLRMFTFLQDLTNCLENMPSKKV